MNFVSKTPSGSIKNRKALLLCGFILGCAGFSLLQLGVSRAQEAAAPVAADAAADKQAVINAKLAEIKALQGEISRYQADLSAKQKAGKTLANEIAIYDGSIAKNQLEIRETKMSIEAAELEMAAAQVRIVEGQGEVERNRQALKEYIQTLYGYQQDSFLEVLISRESLSDYFNEVDAVGAVQSKILSAVDALRQERADLKSRNQELEDNQVAYAQLIAMRYEQNADLEDLKAQKSEILEITNGEEDRYQALLNQNKSLLPSLRAELRDLQSLGQDIKFDDAISAARYVGTTTGVRPALLLAILRVESGLGTNVGGGNYAVDMSPAQRPTFEAIANELGYDPNSLPVSKRPKSYSGWGGAMGPAQMMPTTWRGYQARTSQITGHNPPDPWDLTDSIAAIAVKLADVEGVTSGDYNAEYKAAGIYLAGNNWQKFPFYPQKVMAYAASYEKELNG